MNLLGVFATFLLRCSVRAGSSLILLCCLLSGTGVSQSPGNSALFIAPDADHLLDRSGVLGIDEIAAEKSVKFIPADGRVPNYGVQRAGVMWMRVRIPALDAASVPDWVLSLKFAQIRHFALYLPTASGWSMRAWHKDHAPQGATSATRYPALRVAASDLSGQTVFIRAQTIGSLRAPLWLEPEAAFVNHYSTQSVWFGLLFGILAGLLLYFTAIGVTTRDGALLALSLLIATYLVWAAAFNGFVETAFAPGALTLSRLLEFPGLYLLCACAVGYSTMFLRVGEYFPRVARAAWIFLGILVLLAIEAAYAVLTDTIRLPPVLPYFALLSVLIIFGMPLLVMRIDRVRSVEFLLCWIPTLVAWGSELVLLVNPSIGGNPVVLNAQLFAFTATLALLALITSLDLRRREHSFHAAQDKNRELEIANKYKSHFIAAASHDLRQPLHALNLFAAQLREEREPTERIRLVSRIGAAINSMNELFGALLDMTKLDAGVLAPSLTEFPLRQLFEKIETTFAETAKTKNLSLRIVSTDAWVRSDSILLERVLMNLVSNAIRYTQHGGIVIGCRRREGELRIDVVDTGPGIPEDQRRKVFDEYYQFEMAEADRRGSLGLGLAIVDRIGRLLDHRVELESALGKGSRFSVTVPVASEGAATESAVSPALIADPVLGKLIIVVDDDPLVLEGMSGLLGSWGCIVVTGDSDEAAMAKVAGRRPDLIISDYRLGGGNSGIDAIERLRTACGAEIPAFLISGDTAPERLRDASANGLQLLHKPVPPIRLRAMLNQLLRARPAAIIAPAAE